MPWLDILVSVSFIIYELILRSVRARLSTLAGGIPARQGTAILPVASHGAYVAMCTFKRWQLGVRPECDYVFVASTEEELELRAAVDRLTRSGSNSESF